MGDDIGATLEDLRSRGVTVHDDVEDQGFDLVTSIDIPGAGSMMLDEPSHDEAHGLEG